MSGFDDIIRPASLKLDRANFHINDLNRQIKLFLERKPFRGIYEHDYSSGETSFRIKQDLPIPDEISLTLGDAIHNIRSSLDILLFSIVGNVTKNPSKVQFPIARNADAIEGQITKGQAHLARKEVINEIKALEPYPGGRYLLHELHTLDIADKHRLILTTTHVAQISGRQFADMVSGFDHPQLDHLDFRLDAGAVIAASGPRMSRRSRRATGTPTVVEKEIEPQPSFEICFEKGQALAGEPVIPKLHELWTNVSEACLLICRAEVS